ncbi:enoyl-CoA hydratase/isomerase family protein [Rhodococcus zopfii]|uniref:enoyl-CoA hydratase/isomerase family protein n=1 Tax=Rhodococcus zopfii TaxID=43772 RepID=UPI0035295952
MGAVTMNGDAAIRTVGVADLAAGAAHTPLLAAGGVVDTPVLVVDLDDAPEDLLAVAADRARDCDRLLVGRYAGSDIEDAPELGLLLDALDLTYVAGPHPRERTVVGADDLDDAITGFVAAVARNPYAALTAGQVLRAAETLPVPAAIDVESLGYSTLQGGPEFHRWLDERGPRPLPPAAPQEPVLIARDGDTLHITLNRPERRNAYGTQLRDALVEALGVALLDDSIGRVVLDGAGPSFCAGGDLDEFGRTPDTAVAHLIRTRGGAGRLVARLQDRVEVRVHGHCVGAGIEIPAFAGRIVAAPGTVFRLPEVSMGLIPGAGGTVSVPRRIGRWRALHLFVTAVAIGAEQALSWGLIDEIPGA